MGKTVTPLRRLKEEGETSTPQTSKYTNKMWKTNQSSRMTERLSGYNFFPDLTVRTGVSAYMVAAVTLLN